jgi:hypothetical protein
VVVAVVAGLHDLSFRLLVWVVVVAAYLLVGLMASGGLGGLHYMPQCGSNGITAGGIGGNSGDGQ